MTTTVRCIDCTTEYTAESHELPVRCIECGGNLKNTKEPEQPEEVWSDKA